MERIKRSMVASGWGREGRMIGYNTEDFQSTEQIVYDTLMMIYIILHCSNSQNMQHQDWTIIQTMDFLCLWCINGGSIACNKCTALVGDADNGVNHACVGARGLWEISVPTPHFAMN